MKYSLLLIALFSLLACCEIQEATNEELEKVISTQSFDSGYIKNIDQYDEIKSFIQSNLDTLISYLNSNYKVIRIEANTIDTIIQPQDCHTFTSTHDEKNAPEFIQNILKEKWEKIGSNKKISFCKDGEISFVVKYESIQNGVYAVHSLIWHETIELNHKLYSKEKSKKINNDWTYKIGLVEDYGW